MGDERSRRIRLRVRLKGLLALKGNIPALALSEYVSSNVRALRAQPGRLDPRPRRPGEHEAVVGSGSRVLTGRISDCVGRKALQVAAFVLSITGVAICLMADSWPLLIPAAVLFAVGDALWSRLTRR
ncbi:TPA: hypothetical protein EYP44_01620 [Candidatus Bathyarchaeota archaeon]|nr:hypothetical protein [Candidatus Bathyarchaeota archaeon]